MEQVYSEQVSTGVFELADTPPNSNHRAVLEDVNYYGKTRAEMLAFIPDAPTRLIDIGCGEGWFGKTVKDRYPHCETWGIEPTPEAAGQAELRNDKIINSSIENSGDVPSEHFDVATMNDVLEHLTWPEPALAFARRILRPNGKLILSLPNVQYYRNVSDLIFRNDWEYLDYGILDRTHFRFYTTKSAIRLLEGNGFHVESISGINAMPIEWYYRLLFAVMPTLFRWMRYPQFAIVARKSD